jgi:hypothetical protein
MFELAIFSTFYYNNFFVDSFSKSNSKQFSLTHVFSRMRAQPKTHVQKYSSLRYIIRARICVTLDARARLFRNLVTNYNCL